MSYDVDDGTYEYQRGSLLRVSPRPVESETDVTRYPHIHYPVQQSHTHLVSKRLNNR